MCLPIKWDSTYTRAPLQIQYYIIFLEQVELLLVLTQCYFLILGHSPELYIHLHVRPHLITADNSLENKMQILSALLFYSTECTFSLMIIVHSTIYICWSKFAMILEPKRHVHKIYKPGYHQFVPLCYTVGWGLYIPASCIIVTTHT